MATQTNRTWPIVTIVFAILLFIVALPTEYKRWAPQFLRSPSLHYGLDLVGGTQLDFRISEQEMDEQILEAQQHLQKLNDQGAGQEQINRAQIQLAALREQKRNVVEAIRTVLERRINAMGVSEATITPSYFGSEKHLLVECPGVVDTQECINTVGKTIALEFKEEFTEATAEFEAEVRQKSQIALERMTTGAEAFQIVGQDLSDEVGVAYQEETRLFLDQVAEGMEAIWEQSPEDGVQQYEGVIQVPQMGQDGEVTERDVQGIFLAEVLTPPTSTGRTINEADKAFSLLGTQEENLTYQQHVDILLDESVPALVATQLRSMNPGDMEVVTLDEQDARLVFLRKFQEGLESMSASHILLSYSGSTAGEGIDRTKEDALAFAKLLKKRIDDGESFEALARQYSNGPSGTEGGSLGSFDRTEMVAPFSQAAFALQAGQITDPVETQFGYHLIRADSAPVKAPDTAGYEELIIAQSGATTRAEAVVASLRKGDVKSEEEQIHVRTLFFSLVPSGWKDTALDGKHFRSATVTLDPYSNRPVVQITFDDEGAKLFGELTERNISKPIAIFVGGQIVSAPTVQTAITDGVAIITGSANLEEARQLATDLNTGAIPAPIYLSGQRTVEATLGADALRTSMKAALIGIVILMTYMVVVYRFLGLLADVALSVYAFIFFAILKLPLGFFSDTYIVLTLAGMAGIILSIGMAVDANVLIFERMKEELRKGKMLRTAATTGFERAWPSIRDGNMSTIITCSILFLIGTSIVRGFAITLGLGVMISMFSAIVVTRWLLIHIASSPLADKLHLFAGKNPQLRN